MAKTDGTNNISTYPEGMHKKSVQGNQCQIIAEGHTLWEKTFYGCTYSAKSNGAKNTPDFNDSETSLLDSTAQGDNYTFFISYHPQKWKTFLLIWNWYPILKKVDPKLFHIEVG